MFTQCPIAIQFIDILIYGVTTFVHHLNIFVNLFLSISLFFYQYYRWTSMSLFVIVLLQNKLLINWIKYMTHFKFWNNLFYKTGSIFIYFELNCYQIKIKIKSLPSSTKMLIQNWLFAWHTIQTSANYSIPYVKSISKQSTFRTILK